MYNNCPRCCGCLLVIQATQSDLASVLPAVLRDPSVLATAMSDAPEMNHPYFHCHYFLKLPLL